jgi:hypothetical protein
MAEADGLGGFASGTVSGIRTRRYHALHLAATKPPSGRVVLVNGYDAWVETEGGTFLSRPSYTTRTLCTRRVTTAPESARATKQVGRV